MKDHYDDTMRLIRRTTYRLKVRQEGGRFIEVKDWNDVLKERKADKSKNDYDLYFGFSGYDEHHYPEREEVDLV